MLRCIYQRKERYAIDTRTRFTGNFKAKAALEAPHGDKTIQGDRHVVQGPPELGKRVEQQAMEGMKEVFSKGGGAESWGP